MHFVSTIIFLVGIAVGLTNCQEEILPLAQDKPMFDSIPSVTNVTPLISEVSGIADSKTNPGFLWVEEDGGNPTQLYLLKHNGAVQKKIFIKGVVNRDWEDMVLVGTDIYLAEIGDNNGVYPDCAFYKFPEPLASVDTIRDFETYRFTYADGPRDAEAFLVDPTTAHIYIITKRDNPSRIYRLTAPLSATGNNVAQQVGQLSYSGVVSSAISADGKEILVKTYLGLNYYKRPPGESVETSLQKVPTIVPYRLEPQGEAVCFSSNNNGYFTLSEKAYSADVKLYFYRRN